jgi:hypothetical protein
MISKEMLQAAAIRVEDEPIARVIKEKCELQIVKAILEKGRRKWEFMWRGVRISAPVLDESFHSKFWAHEITIAPGDELHVQLAIKQIRDSKTGIYTNVEYEVVEVFKHVPGIRQMPLE